MAGRWYVLGIKRNKEQALWQQLKDQGFEVFHPRFLKEDGHPKELRSRPYFPGYIFIRLDLDVVRLSIFQWMPLTTGLVCFGGMPAYVPENLISALKKHALQVNKIPDGIETHTEIAPSIVEEDELMRVDKLVFDTQISGHERVRALLGLLQGISVDPEVSVNCT